MKDVVDFRDSELCACQKTLRGERLFLKSVSVRTLVGLVAPQSQVSPVPRHQQESQQCQGLGTVRCSIRPPVALAGDANDSCNPRDNGSKEFLPSALEGEGEGEWLVSLTLPPSTSPSNDQGG